MNRLLRSIRQLLVSPGVGFAIASVGLAVGPGVAIYATSAAVLSEQVSGVANGQNLFDVSLAQSGRSDLGSLGFSAEQLTLLEGIETPFSGIAAFAKVSGVLGHEGRAEEVVVEFVNGTFFEVLGVRPAVGDLLQPQSAGPGLQPVAVLSYWYWMERFGGRIDVVGASVRVNGVDTRVIGVAAADFQGYRLDWNGPTAAWIPMSASESLGRGALLVRPAPYLRLIGRTPGPAEPSEVAVRVQGWPSILPEMAVAMVPDTILLQPASATRLSRRGSAERYINLLLVIWAIACGAAVLNVSNVYLARAVAAREGVAVRWALGASRARLIGAALVEGLMFAGLATMAAILSAALSATLLAPLLPHYLGVRIQVTELAPILAPSGADVARATGFCALMALGCALVPLRSALATPGIEFLRGAGVSLRRSWRLRRLLLSFQVALSVALTAASVVLVRSGSMLGAGRVFPDAKDVVLARVVMTALPPAERPSVYRQLLATAEADPRVLSASLGGPPPLTMGIATLGSPSEGNLEVAVTTTGPRYFSTLGSPVLRGRDFSSDELEAADAIISEDLATTLWPGQDPIGRGIDLGGRRRVVGVVSAEACNGGAETPTMCVWETLPYASGSAYLLVRTTHDAEGLLRTLPQRAGELHPDVAVTQETTLKSYLVDVDAPAVGALRGSILLALLSVTLLLVGCASFFKALMQADRRSMAVRSALGASPGRITAGWAMRSTGLVVVGAVMGAALFVSVQSLGWLDWAGAGNSLGAVLAAIVPTTVLAVGTVAIVAWRVANSDAVRHLTG